MGFVSYSTALCLLCPHPMNAGLCLHFSQVHNKFITGKWQAKLSCYFLMSSCLGHNLSSSFKPIPCNNKLFKINLVRLQTRTVYIFVILWFHGNKISKRRAPAGGKYKFLCAVSIFMTPASPFALFSQNLIKSIYYVNNRSQQELPFLSCWITSTYVNLSMEDKLN